MIRNTFLILVACFSLGYTSYAQKANGTVKSLIEADENLNYAFFKNGIPNAFLKYADEGAMLFQPEPVALKSVYQKTKSKDENEALEWKPEYARIAKKGDLGFTSGRFELTENGHKQYGVYLNIWKNVNGKWKLLQHAKTYQPQLIRETKFDYFEPKNDKYYKLIGPQKIQMRDDIVMGTDELFGKRLAAKNGNKYLSEFYDAGVRLYFPKKYPTYNLEETLNFVLKNKLSFKSTSNGVVRAFSGDLAFTHGEATVSGKNYHYLRAWQIEEETGKWNVIVDMYLD